MGEAQSGAPALVREGSGCARSESPRRTAPMPHFERRAFTTSRFVISGATRCGGRIGGGDDKKAGAAQSWAAARSVLLPSLIRADGARAGARAPRGAAHPPRSGLRRGFLPLPRFRGAKRCRAGGSRGAGSRAGSWVRVGWATWLVMMIILYRVGAKDGPKN